MKEPKGVVRRPNIQSHNPRFYHESQRSRLSIRYRNTGLNPAYNVRTDLAVFLDGNSVPIEKDTFILSRLAPNRGLELRGTLSDAFFENVMIGKATFVMEFTARYQNDQGQEYEAVSSVAIQSEHDQNLSNRGTRKLVRRIAPLDCKTRPKLLGGGGGGGGGGSRSRSLFISLSASTLVPAFVPRRSEPLSYDW